MNSELEADSSADKYRKEFTRKFKDLVESLPVEEEKSDEDKIIESIEEKLVQMRKEKTYLSDLRRDVNTQLRSIDRYEDIRSIAIECANEMKEIHSRFEFKPIYVKENESKVALLMLSDWHYGLIVDDFFNRYDPEICKKRLQKVLTDVITNCEYESITSIVIFNLADLISGRIHSQIRIQSRFDAVTQTQHVTEMLVEFISTLREYGFNVSYYDCLDNHSRVEPNKKESLQLESFTRFTSWYLEAVFKEVDGVDICRNSFGPSIICTDICGHTFVGVHGDKDAPNSVVQKISSLVGYRPDVVCMAHRHHFSCDEENKCVVVCNPSLIGADDYALDQRKTSSPAQTMIVVTPSNPVQKIYRLMA